MLRTNINLASYKFNYSYNKFAVYSNIDKNILKAPSIPVTINTHNDRLLADLLNTPELLKFICNNQKVLAITLVGSRALNLADHYSDYDLLVITDDEDKYINNKQDYYIIYNNEFGIHWYSYSKNLLYNTNVNSVLECGMFWQLSAMKFITIWDEVFIKSYSLKLPKLINFACINCYKLLAQSAVKQVLKTNELPKTKYLYHLCIASHFLEGTQLNKQFLIELKRIRYKEISKDCISYCIERLNLFKELVEKCH